MNSLHNIRDLLSSSQQLIYHLKTNILQISAKASEQWGDDIQPTQKVGTGAPDQNPPQMGYISPYTLPFPGTPGKLKQTEEIRADPVGKTY